MNITLILYLLILVSTISFGTVRLKSLTFPLKIVYAICVLSFLNEILVHYVFTAYPSLFLTYHLYLYIVNSLYYFYFALIIRNSISRIIVLVLGLTLLINGVFTEWQTIFTAFPSVTISSNAAGFVACSLIFINYRLKNPISLKISHDSEFLIVLLILVYWAVFISKHAFQSEIIRQNLRLPLIEELFTFFSMCYYCGLGIVFYRHKTNESRPAV